jgi:hypothetical protein
MTGENRGKVSDAVAKKVTSRGGQDNDETSERTENDEIDPCTAAGGLARNCRQRSTWCRPSPRRTILIAHLAGRPS